LQPVFVAYATCEGRALDDDPGDGAELAPKVRINAIEVGGVETQALSHVLNGLTPSAAGSRTTPRCTVWAKPEDVARVRAVPRVGRVVRG